MPPTTTTSTHCSHCTLHFCVLLLLVLLSGYHCQDICVDYPERLECISKINSNSNINCTEIEEKTLRESASFTCDIPKDIMVTNLIWLFYPSGGQQRETVPIGGRISKDINQITINDLRSDDEGLYICEYEPSNNPGEMTQGRAGCIIIYSTANITSPQKTISIPRGANLILPTHLTFESSGSCGLKPIVNAARLQFSPMMNQSNPTTLVLCEPSCTVLPDGITYNFSAFGNITITNAYEGYYMMGMQRPCPSPSYIIAATYTVTYSSPVVSSPLPSSLPSSLSMAVSPSTEVHSTDEIDVALYVSLGVSGAVVVVVLIVVATIVILCLRVKRKPASSKSEHTYEYLSNTDGNATVTTLPNEPYATTANPAYGMLHSSGSVIVTTSPNEGCVTTDNTPVSSIDI